MTRWGRLTETDYPDRGQTTLSHNDDAQGYQSWLIVVA